MCVTFNVLTVYMAKDVINEKCYNSVLRQEGVKQDIIVISAKKIEVANNFVADVPQEYPLPIRVGLSINRALPVYWDKKKYDYFFKVDNDVLLPPDYLLDLISKNKPIIGPGNAMLIEAGFFKNQFGSRWAITYSDDEYMKACAFAMGFIEQLWEKDLNLDSVYRPSLSREYMYGKEYYKFGIPLWFMLVRLIASIKNYFKRRTDRIPITMSIYSIGGYISALATKKYQWHNTFSKRWTMMHLRRFVSKLRRYLKAV